MRGVLCEADGQTQRRMDSMCVCASEGLYMHQALVFVVCTDACGACASGSPEVMGDLGQSRGEEICQMEQTAADGWGGGGTSGGWG